MKSKQNMFEIITKSAEETKRVGSFFSEEANKFFSKNNALILCLNGDLGGGKTTFTQGLAKGFGIKQKVNSPTFLIIKKYSVSSRNFNKLKFRQPFALRTKELDQIGIESRRPSSFNKKGCPKGDSARAKRVPIWKKNNFKNFYHLDCYRLKDPQELIDLGFKEMISDKNNFIVIEWAEKIKKILPSENVINFQFDFLDFNKRRITIKN